MDAGRAIEADRSRRLGLVASVAFSRFVRLYRKYSPDQPRDDRGRWVETGSEGDIDATGSVTPIVNEVRTGDLEIDSVTQKLAEKLAEVVDALGEGSGLIYGTRVHAAFAEAVRNSGIPNLQVERSWLDGELIPTYGFAGSIRTDVVLRRYDDSSPVRAIWDVKTGDARLSAPRRDELRRQVGVGSEVPVLELSVRRGVAIKGGVLVGALEKTHVRI
jgi:hypothetical protein